MCVKKADRIYVMPEAAKKKMQQAKKKRQTVYIYGATCYGKTEFVKQFLKFRNYVYFSCQDYAKILDEGVSWGKNCEILVIDDIQAAYGDRVRQKICELILAENVWLILIGRSPVPFWILESYFKTNMMIISEDDMRLRKSEIREMGLRHGLELTEEELAYSEKYSEGNGFVVLQTMQQVLEGYKIGPELTSRNTELMSAYIEKNLLPVWDKEVLDFLVKVSVVEEFDLELAEFITGNPRVCSLIEKSRETGNFLFQHQGIYYIRPTLLISLRSYAAKEYGREWIKELQYNAGLYYEIHDRLLEALRMYERSGNEKKIRDILLRNARQNPAAGFYFELRNYYLRLTEEEVEGEPELMGALSMLYSLLMQPEESEYWYHKLENYSKMEKGIARRNAEARLAYLTVALPHRGIKGLTEILVSMAKFILSCDLAIPEFSLTSNLPSVMNGGKDFSEWSKRDRELAATIGKPVTFVLGKYGKGLVNEALGESFFEKGENNFETLRLLSKAQIEAENGGKKELTFAIIGLQSRLHLVGGDLALAQEQLDSYERKLDKEDARQLFLNLQAFRCRLHFYENNQAAIQEWIKEAPDENETFFIMERYRYLTKVRYYILRAEYIKGLSLLERLQYYAEQYDRPYLSMEVDILESIILDRMGEEWQELFLKLLKKAGEYGFVRIISQEGAAVFPLLKKIRVNYSPETRKEKEWWKKVYTETEKIANYYPGYLNAENAAIKDFSEHAIRILQLQAEGMTIRQIAQTIGLAETTIKYHAAENYRKLNVKGKTDAVQKAKSLKII